MSSLQQWIVGTSDGKLATSPDSTTFTEQIGFNTAFGTHQVNCAVHNRSLTSPLWVVGGDAGKLVTSTDGVTWTLRTLGFGTNTVWSVAYDNVGRYVAVGTNNSIATSTDAITWTPVSSPFASGSTLRVVAHDFTGSWCIAADTPSGVQVASSSNGTTWSLVSLPTMTGTPTVSSFAHNHLAVSGLWVLIVHASSNYLITSADSATWISQPSPPGNLAEHTSLALTSDESTGTLQWAQMGHAWSASISNDGINWSSHGGGLGPGSGPEDEFSIATDRAGIYLITGSLGTPATGGPSIYSWNPVGADPGTVTVPAGWTSNVVTAVAYSIGAAYRVPRTLPFVVNLQTPSTNPSIPPHLGLTINMVTPRYVPPIPVFTSLGQGFGGITTIKTAFTASSTGNATSALTVAVADILGSTANALTVASSTIVTTQTAASTGVATSHIIMVQTFSLTTSGNATATPSVVYDLVVSLMSAANAADVSTIGGVYGNAVASIAVGNGQVSFAWLLAPSSTGAATSTPTMSYLLANLLSTSGIAASTLTSQLVVPVAFISAIHAADAVTMQQVVTNLLADGVVVVGDLSLGGIDYTVWVLNASTLAPAPYTNFPFNSYAHSGKRLHGAASDGIYIIGVADNDNGTPIAASFRTRLDNLGSDFEKRNPDAFFGFSSNGTMVIKAMVTEPSGTNGRSQKNEYWYTLQGRQGSSTRSDRAKLGRGLKSVYWQFEIANKNGADFDFNAITLSPLILDRRIG